MRLGVLVRAEAASCTEMRALARRLLIPRRMDDARLRELAAAFYDKAWTDWHAESTPKDREFWTREYVEFARAVRSATRESDAGALNHIYNLAIQYYERLPAREKMLGIGRMLYGIAEMANRKG